MKICRPKFTFSRNLFVGNRFNLFLAVTFLNFVFLDLFLAVTISNFVFRNLFYADIIPPEPKTNFKNKTFFNINLCPPLFCLTYG